MKLRKEYDMLNPAELKRKITKLQNRLLILNILNQEANEDLDKKRSLQVGSSTFQREELRGEHQKFIKFFQKI